MILVNQGGRERGVGRDGVSRGHHERVSDHVFVHPPDQLRPFHGTGANSGK